MYEVDRLEDMSPTGYLHLFWQRDGDIIVTVHQAEDGSLQRESTASIEICTHAGGGAGFARLTPIALLFHDLHF